MLPSPRCPPALPVHMGMVGAPSAGRGQRGQSDRRPFSLPSPETSPSAPRSLCRLSPGSVPAIRSPRDASCSALRRPWMEAEPRPWHSTVTPEAYCQLLRWWALPSGVRADSCTCRAAVGGWLGPCALCVPVRPGPYESEDGEPEERVWPPVSNCASAFSRLAFQDLGLSRLPLLALDAGSWPSGLPF